jgi:hypothetical protein
MSGAGFRVIAMAFLVAALMVAPPAPVASQSSDWVESIRQCWNDVNRNASIGCYLTEGKLRGSLSAKECLVEAIKSARANDREAAVRWILACHCGTNRTQVKQAIRDHKDEAVRFVVETYGAFVP